MTNDVAPNDERRDEFDRLVAPSIDQVRRALIVQFGIEIGSEVTADVAAWAWEHIEIIVTVTNPAGYLFRVGQSAARRHRRWQRGRTPFPANVEWVAQNAPELDDELVAALRGLKSEQRVSVVLVHGYAFTYAEVAALLSISEAAVTNHIHRGLAKLRRLLEDQS